MSLPLLHVRAPLRRTAPLVGALSSSAPPSDRVAIGAFMRRALARGCVTETQLGQALGAHDVTRALRVLAAHAQRRNLSRLALRNAPAVPTLDADPTLRTPGFEDRNARARLATFLTSLASADAETRRALAPLPRSDADLLRVAAEGWTRACGRIAARALATLRTRGCPTIARVIPSALLPNFEIGAEPYDILVEPVDDFVMVKWRSFSLVPIATRAALGGALRLLSRKVVSHHVAAPADLYDTYGPFQTLADELIEEITPRVEWTPDGRAVIREDDAHLLSHEVGMDVEPGIQPHDGSLARMLRLRRDLHGACPGPASPAAWLRRNSSDAWAPFVRVCLRAARLLRGPELRFVQDTDESCLPVWGAYAELSGEESAKLQDAYDMRMNSGAPSRALIGANAQLWPSLERITVEVTVLSALTALAYDCDRQALESS